MAMIFVRGSIKEKAGIDIEDLEITEFAKKC